MMASLQTFSSIIGPQLDEVNSRIRQRLETSNHLTNQVIEMFLSKRGKQIRPTVVLLVSKMLGGIADDSITSAVAVELLHNASLIHDDVVDNSMLRRGMPTVNAVWDNHIAVLVGDFFVTAAMHQALQTRNLDIIDTICFMGRMLSLGELDQIYNARNHNLTEDAYFHIIESKTASLFVACAKMGCYSVGVTDERVDRIAEFARLLGLCFQLRDDIFDYYADPKVGKPTGNDLREGKVTLPLLHVLLDDTLPAHERMLELSSRDNLSDEEISMLMDYAVANGGIDYAYATMARLRDEAVDILADFPDNEAHSALLSVLDNIIARDY